MVEIVRVNKMRKLDKLALSAKAVYLRQYYKPGHSPFAEDVGIS